MPDPVGSTGTGCQQMTGVPSGNCAAGSTGNAVCMFSIYTFSYVCCYNQVQVTFTTPGPGSTFATVGPGSTVAPQNLKPICPNGALSSISAYTNQPALCNRTDLQNQGCPLGFTCSVATNLMNLYGQAIATSQYNMGAAMTPNLCCKTDTLQSYTNVFIDSGLSPTIVPGAPTTGIASVLLNTSSAIGLTDDYSYIPGQITVQPSTINLLTPSTLSTVYYHVLFFDSTTNHDCWFFANINTSSNTASIPLPSASALTPPAAFASVYNAGTTTTPLWTFGSTWMGPTNNIVSHRFVVLVWTTTKALQFAPASPKSTTMLQLGGTMYGDFAPSTSSQGTVKGGSFTTVSALLKGKFSTILGTPKYGTYFYLMS
jgi:hypothetical protein